VGVRRRRARPRRRDARLGSTSRGACETFATTIVGKHDFVVIVRRWRQQGTRRRADAWAPVAVVDDRAVASSMAELLVEATPRTEARVLSGSELLRELHAEDRERIVEQLNSRTNGDVKRAQALRQAALARRDRRSGADRRSGVERRLTRKRHAAERRSGHDRRSGVDRRAA
jgi:hypothetical protein